VYPQARPEKQPEAADRKPEAEQEYYQSNAPMKSILILKPGENTNCGNIIQVSRDFDEIVEIVTESSRGSKRITCIVQKYIHNPLLIYRRKFNIVRTPWLALSEETSKGISTMKDKRRIHQNELLWVRCQQFADRSIYLTNYAILKKFPIYGKFEPGNKMSYNEFQVYLDNHYGEVDVCFERDLVPYIDKLSVDMIRAVHDKLDPKRRVNTFEVFGLDFMIDDELKLYLIIINSNPCLDLSALLLAKMIPNMI
jgi:hypothetical protein